MNRKQIGILSTLAMLAILSTTISGVLAATNQNISYPATPSTSNPWYTNWSSYAETSWNEGITHICQRELLWSSTTNPNANFYDWTFKATVGRNTITAYNSYVEDILYMKMVGNNGNGQWSGTGVKLDVFCWSNGGVLTWTYGIYWVTNAGETYVTSIVRTTSNTGVTIDIRAAGSQTYYLYVDGSFKGSFAGASQYINDPAYMEAHF